MADPMARRKIPSIGCRRVVVNRPKKSTDRSPQIQPGRAFAVRPNKLTIRVEEALQSAYQLAREGTGLAAAVFRRY
jgi:hypothetical protein